MASKLLGIHLKILGKPVYQPEYFVNYRRFFDDENVELLGMRFGREKMEIISRANCAIYTLDKDYCEAGTGVLGEILASGVPIAGISWTGDDAVCEAVNDERLGSVSILGRD